MDWEDDDEETEDIAELISRYESMASVNHSMFFDIDDFVDIIDYYYLYDKISQAYQAAETARSLYPQNVDIELAYCKILLGDSREADALDVLEPLYQSNPHDVEVICFLASVYGDMKMNFEAIKILETLDDVNDDNVHAHLLLAEQYQAVGEIPKAENLFCNIVRKYPDNPIFIDILADFFDDCDLLDEKIVFFEELTSKNSFNKYAWFYLGHAYFGKNNHEKALECFDFVLALDSDSTSTLVTKGVILTIMEKYSEAIDSFREALELNENDDAVYSYIGDCFYFQNSYANAVRYYQRSLQINDLNVTSNVGLANIYKIKGEFDRALKYVEKVIKSDEITSDCFRLKASIFVAMDRYEEAEKVLQEAIDLDTQDVIAWIMMSEMKDILYGRQEAIRLLGTAVEIVKENAPLLFRKSALLFLNGQDDLAASCLHSAMLADKSAIGDFFDYDDRLKNNLTVIKVLSEFDLT